jgi:endonuclease/exonuclease/phosphatase family metal-dependent hydrolase
MNEVVRIATFNVHRLEKSDNIQCVLDDNFIDVCGMQEVSGLQALKRAFNQDQWVCMFDGGYPTYGNGLVFRKSKFTIKKQITHTLKPTPGKKTAFEVWLEDIKHPTNVLRIFVTHLDYKTEPQRMRELSNLNEIITSGDCRDSPHIILADLNSLTLSDYSKQQWDTIVQTRKANNWEAPQTEVTSTLAKWGYVDVLSVCKGVTGTCRFDTRVDYVLTRGLMHKHSFVVDSLGSSDHKVVVVDL